MTGAKSADESRSHEAGARRSRATDARHALARARRELRSVRRTPALHALIAGVAAAFTAFAWTAGASDGYVPTVVALSTPAEVLVPVLGFALGYRVLLDDRRGGELAVLDTLPPSDASVVAGTALGRGVALAVGVAVALAPSLLLAWLAGGSGSALYAAQRGADSPLLFARFVALTTLFGLSVLSVALATSAVADRPRSAVALVAVVWVPVAVAADLGSLAALSGAVFGPDAVVALQAVSPASAYRGLVLETVLGAATGPSVRAGAPALDAASLLAWTVGGLALATGRLRE
ncbi:ABC transporter permease [Halorussus litoreus]|uniref:ABC transporter permease n=1 Tax=Halorussus litoreus TaxID=1710536 RepID=UPI000E23E17E|nr:ABC transporter permease subunit [Halorussus litoreus]